MGYDPSLEYYIKKYGDFIVTCGSKKPEDEKPSFETWKQISNLSPDDINKINLRQVLPDEVVFDCEDSATKDKVIENLTKDNYGFAVWITGSRGFHIHMFAPDIRNESSEFRELFKLDMIERYGGDRKMKETTRLVAIENRPHFKTGNKKECIKIYGDPENNQIAFAVVSAVVRKLQQGHSAVVNSPPDKKMAKFGEQLFIHCRELGKKEILPTGERHSIFLKNTAIGMVVYGVEDAVAINLLEDICMHQNMQKEEAMGWYEGAKKGKYTTFNVYEMLKWIRDNKLPMYQPDERYLETKRFSEGVLYIFDNQYWVKEDKTYVPITNFIFHISSKTLTTGQSFFEIELIFVKGHSVKTKVTTENDLVGATRFKNLLYGCSESVKLYGTAKKKHIYLELLFEFFRESLDDAREELFVLDLQADLNAVLEDGFRKYRIGIEGINTGMGAPELMIGKKVSERILLFPSLLLKYFNSQGYKLRSPRELLDLMRKNFSKIKFASVRKGTSVVSSWEVSYEEINDIISKAVKEQEQITATDEEREIETLKDQAKKAYTKVCGIIAEGVNMDEEEAGNIYALLEAEGYFANNQNQNIKDYLVANGAMPF
jgi:hypothetical protein